MNIKNWADEFVKLAVVEMDKDLTRIFLNLSLDKERLPPTQIEQLFSFSFRVVFNRAISIFSKVDWQAAAFLAVLVNSPGSAIMYLYAVRVFYKELTMDTIAKVYPNGFLSDESLSIMWDKQKIGGRNFLDTLTEEDFHEINLR